MGQRRPPTPVLTSDSSSDSGDDVPPLIGPADPDYVARLLGFLEYARIAAQREAFATSGPLPPVGVWPASSSSSLLGHSGYAVEDWAAGYRSVPVGPRLGDWESSYAPLAAPVLSTDASAATLGGAFSSRWFSAPVLFSTRAPFGSTLSSQQWVAGNNPLADALSRSPPARRPSPRVRIIDDATLAAHNWATPPLLAPAVLRQRGSPRMAAAVPPRASSVPSLGVERSLGQWRLRPRAASAPLQGASGRFPSGMAPSSAASSASGRTVD